MLVEELQAIAINLDGAPGVRRDQVGEVCLEVIDGEAIRTLIKVLGIDIGIPKEGKTRLGVG